MGGWGLHAQWSAVNNLPFGFIGNRDTTLFSTRTPLGQGLQTHSSTMHHRKRTESHFMLLYYLLSPTIKQQSPVAWTQTGGLLARWRDASQLLCDIWWKFDCDACFMLLYIMFRRLLLSLVVLMNRIYLQIKECWHKGMHKYTLHFGATVAQW